MQACKAAFAGSKVKFEACTDHEQPNLFRLLPGGRLQFMTWHFTKVEAPIFEFQRLGPGRVLLKYEVSSHGRAMPLAES